MSDKNQRWEDCIPGPWIQAWGGSAAPVFNICGNHQQVLGLENPSLQTGRFSHVFLGTVSFVFFFFFYSSFLEIR